MCAFTLSIHAQGEGRGAARVLEKDGAGKTPGWGQPSWTPDLRHEDDSSKQEVSVTPQQACRPWEAEAEDCNFKA